MHYLRKDGDDLLLELQVQPRASRDELVGAHGGALRVRITAAPVNGAANAHLLRYLAKVFAVSRRDVLLLSGETSRRKRVRIVRPRKLPAALSTSETE